MPGEFNHNPGLQAALEAARAAKQRQEKLEPPLESAAPVETGTGQPPAEQENESLEQSASDESLEKKPGQPAVQKSPDLSAEPDLESRRQNLEADSREFFRQAENFEKQIIENANANPVLAFVALENWQMAGLDLKLKLQKIYFPGQDKDLDELSDSVTDSFSQNEAKRLDWWDKIGEVKGLNAQTVKIWFEHKLQVAEQARQLFLQGDTEAAMEARDLVYNYTISVSLVRPEAESIFWQMSPRLAEQQAEIEKTMAIIPGCWFETDDETGLSCRIEIKAVAEGNSEYREVVVDKTKFDREKKQWVEAEPAEKGYLSAWHLQALANREMKFSSLDQLPAQGATEDFERERNARIALRQYLNKASLYTAICERWNYGDSDNIVLAYSAFEKFKLAREDWGDGQRAGGLRSGLLQEWRQELEDADNSYQALWGKFSVLMWAAHQEKSRKPWTQDELQEMSGYRQELLTELEQCLANGDTYRFNIVENLLLTGNTGYNIEPAVPEDLLAGFKENQRREFEEFRALKHEYYLLRGADFYQQKEAEQAWLNFTVIGTPPQNPDFLEVRMVTFDNKDGSQRGSIQTGLLRKTTVQDIAEGRKQFSGFEIPNQEDVPVKSGEAPVAENEPEPPNDELWNDERLDSYEQHPEIVQLKELAMADIKEQNFGAEADLTAKQQRQLEALFRAFWDIEREKLVPQYYKDGLLD